MFIINKMYNSYLTVGRNVWPWLPDTNSIHTIQQFRILEIARASGTISFLRKFHADHIFLNSGYQGNRSLESLVEYIDGSLNNGTSGKPGKAKAQRQQHANKAKSPPSVDNKHNNNNNRNTNSDTGSYFIQFFFLKVGLNCKECVIVIDSFHKLFPCNMRCKIYTVLTKCNNNLPQQIRNIILLICR